MSFLVVKYNIILRRYFIMEYATNAKGNLGVTLGAVGTGLGLLDGGANLLGKVLGTNGMNGNSEDRSVTRYEMGLIRESIDQKIENGYLRGQLETSTKFEGVQKQLAEQMAFNATVSANASAIAAQTAELRNNFDRLTRNFVPNENVAPGWGMANVQPAPPLPPYPYFGFPFVPPFIPPTTQASTNQGTDAATTNNG